MSAREARIREIVREEIREAGVKRRARREYFADHRDELPMSNAVTKMHAKVKDLRLTVFNVASRSALGLVVSLYERVLRGEVVGKDLRELALVESRRMYEIHKDVEREFVFSVEGFADAGVSDAELFDRFHEFGVVLGDLINRRLFKCHELTVLAELSRGNQMPSFWGPVSAALESVECGCEL